MVYQWKAGIPYSPRVDAQIAGEVCEKLSSQNQLSAKELVNVSRALDAPLHNAFEWDDAVAGEEWRREQARHLIKALVVVPQNQDQKPTRGFYHLERQDDCYQPISVILHNPNKYKALLALARSELQAFTQKYQSLQELRPVFEAITVFLAEGDNQ
jgi:hypothetical protein